MTYVEKVDRFTKSTYPWCTRRDSMRHRQYSFGFRADLKTFLDSVCHAEAEKIISKIKNIGQSRKFCTFRERTHFSWKTTPFEYFVFFGRKGVFAKAKK